MVDFLGEWMHRTPIEALSSPTEDSNGSLERPSRSPIVYLPGSCLDPFNNPRPHRL